MRRYSFCCLLSLTQYSVNYMYDVSCFTSTVCDTVDPNHQTMFATFLTSGITRPDLSQISSAYCYDSYLYCAILLASCRSRWQVDRKLSLWVILFSGGVPKSIAHLRSDDWENPFCFCCGLDGSLNRDLLLAHDA